MELNRTQISTLAKAINAETSLGHAKCIAMIAKALGFQDGNALMGTLKNTETPEPKPVADPAGFLYTLTFPFISDEDNLENLSLVDIAYEVDAGGAVGAMGEDMTITKIPLTREDLGALATKFGSTPDFFMLEDDDDNTVFDPRQHLPTALLSIDQEHTDGVADLLSLARITLTNPTGSLLRLKDSPHLARALMLLKEAEDWFNEEGREDRALEKLKEAIDTL